MHCFLFLSCYFKPDRASDNSRGKKSNFAGIFGDKFAEKMADFATIFRANFAEKQRRKPRRKIPEKKIYWKDVKFRERKKTQKFIQTQFSRQLYLFQATRKTHKLYRNARPVNLLFQL